VILEGTSKKAKLVRNISGEFLEGSEDPIADAADAIREAIKDEKIPTDSVGLVVDTGLAAFRSVKVPFSDRSKIEEVIKFEVENQLPQWSIDEVIVDFLVLSTTGVESNLLVTAVPKESLAREITALERAGLEPVEVELEATAMINAAESAGLFDAESACVLVHFGDSSTSVAVVDGGTVKSMRAIHSGAFPAGDGPRNPAAAQAHREEVIARLRRELKRTLSAAATANTIEAVYVCGHTAEGLVGEEILDTPVEMLSVLPDETAEGIESPERFLVAWGAALGQLGGGSLKPSLRREELRFLGKFERLELPLAVLGLLLLTLFSVRAIITHKQIQKQEKDLEIWLLASNNFMLGEPEAGKPGNLRRPPENIRDYARNAEKGEVAQERRYDQLATIDGMLRQEILAVQRDMGSDTTITQPMSALEGVTLVLGVLDGLGDGVEGFSIRHVESTYFSGKGSREDKVLVKLDLTFRGEDTIDATRRFENFLEALREEPWYLEDKPVKQNTLETADGIFLDGFQVSVDPTRAEDLSS
jgi:hypothetical protein